MDRREFFKGMFGVAIVAAIPKQVMDQMVETIPEHEIGGVVSYQGKQRMFLYDDNKLIANSSEFNLILRRNLIDVSDLYYGVPMYPELREGLPQWGVSARIYWDNHKEGLYYFIENKPLQCVIYDRGLIIKGNVYMTECQLTAGLEDYAWEDVVLEGTGELIIEKNESDPNIP